jgi:hypothetical protein
VASDEARSGGQGPALCRHADTQGPGGPEPLRQLLGRRDSHDGRQPRSRDRRASRLLLRALSVRPSGLSTRLAQRPPERLAQQPASRSTQPEADRLTRVGTRAGASPPRPPASQIATSGCERDTSPLRGATAPSAGAPPNSYARAREPEGLPPSRVSKTGDPFRPAIAARVDYGLVLGSFCAEEFGTERVQRLTRDEVGERFAPVQQITSFEAIRPQRLLALDRERHADSVRDPASRGGNRDRARAGGRGRRSRHLQLRRS